MHNIWCMASHCELKAIIIVVKWMFAVSFPAAFESCLVESTRWWLVDRFVQMFVGEQACWWGPSITCSQLDMALLNKEEKLLHKRPYLWPPYKLQLFPSLLARLSSCPVTSSKTRIIWAAALGTFYWLLTPSYGYLNKNCYLRAPPE